VPFAFFSIMIPQIPLFLAAAYILSNEKKVPILSNIINPTPIPDPNNPNPTFNEAQIARSNAQKGFVKWLNDYVEYQKSMGNTTGFGDMGYVRTATAFNILGARLYMSPTRITPDTHEKVARGNYTDMENWIVYVACVDSDPGNPVYNYKAISYSDMRAIIRNYFSTSAFKDNLGPDGPHSTYLTSVWASINFAQVVRFAGKIIQFIGKVLSGHESNASGSSEGSTGVTDDGTDYSDSTNYSNTYGDGNVG
jgi:hypothetical protein